MLHLCSGRRIAAEKQRRYAVPSLTGPPVARTTPDFARLAAFTFDVDGVLTDGGITYLDDGRELKTFNVQDGTATKQLLEAGVEIAWITGRDSPVVARRARELGVTHLYQGQSDKRAAFVDFHRKTGRPAELTAHVGDDLADIGLFELAGMGIAVPNAHPAVLAEADLITTLSGGHGVVRELAELVLKARGLWVWRTPA
jgi:3-deoxy-D-manno-octulosonate 8-phosphate phosphatase (KDO 8-P phosphatase)